jgi:general secretion pathway protein F
LLTAVVPQMAEVFVGRQKTLPLATVLLLQLSEGIRQFGLWILLALACLVLIAAQAFRREALRQRFDALLLRLPMLGAILQGSEVARFAATLALLIEAGLPLLRCLQTASATLGNRALRNDAEAAVRQVREGASLARALGSSARLPRLLVVFVRLGEQTGALAPMLDRVAQQISNQVQRRSMTLATVLEPVLITVLGGVVMFIVLAVLLPIISLQQLQL